MCIRDRFRSGEAGILDGQDIGRDSGSDRLLADHEVADEAGFLAGRDAQHVVQDQDLARAFAAGTDADRRDGQLAGGFRRQRLRDGFEDDQPGARLLLRQCVGDQPRGGGIPPPLNTVAAELVNRLRRQPDVCTCLLYTSRCV